MQLLAAVALVAAAATGARAHDIWLQAEPFVVEPGGLFVVRQLLGAELESDLASGEEIRELPVLLDMTTRFELHTAAGGEDLLAELRADARTPGGGRPAPPILSRALEGGGPALVAMDHAVLYTAFSNEEFLEYLEHEELPAAPYRARLEVSKLQTEGYQRTLKCLVGGPGAEAGASDLHRRVLGQAIEILLLEDPYRLDPGDELRVRVLLHGEPLAGQPIQAWVGDGSGPAGRQRATTGEDGVARLRLDRGGTWLVRLVHLAPCSKRSAVDCSDTAWESYWSAFSFAVD